MSVVADSHAVLWYLQGDSGHLSPAADKALHGAAETDRIRVPIAVLIDLWYVGQSRRELTTDAIRLVHEEVLDPVGDFTVVPIDVSVVNAYQAIPLDVLRDPWDRFITATAIALDLPLVTRDRAIANSGLVEVVW